MRPLVAAKKLWHAASLPAKLSAAGALTVALVVTIAVSADGISQQGEAQILAETSTPTQTATQRASAIPTPTQSVSPEVTPSPLGEEIPRQQAPVSVAAPAAPAAPIFEAFSGTATQYGIGVMMDNGPSTFPTGRIYAASALPAAQGTGPLIYSVSGLPVGAGFDADQRKIFIDTETFIPANQENYTFNFCYTRQRVNLAIAVQYNVSGPGGNTSATVPLQFGLVALGAGILHQGC
jgi:hypothetical protein